MRVVLIDAKKREIREEDLRDDDDEGSLKTLQDAVGGLIECGFQYDNGDCIYVNEEGLFGPMDAFFFIEGSHQPFAGNGVLSGVDDSGDTVDAKMSIDELRQKVRFMNRREAAQWSVENQADFVEEDNG